MSRRKSTRSNSTAEEDDDANNTPTASSSSKRRRLPSQPDTPTPTPSASTSTSTPDNGTIRRSGRKRTEKTPVNVIALHEISSASPTPDKIGPRKRPVGRPPGSSKSSVAAEKVQSPVTSGDEPVIRRSNRTPKPKSKEFSPITPSKSSVPTKTPPAVPTPSTSSKSTPVTAETSKKKSGKLILPKGKVVAAESSSSSSGSGGGSKPAEPEESSQGNKLEWKFNVYGVPKCPLPCRESQFEDIWKFLFENVSERNSGCMYVSGVPGTGKTVIVQAVVDTLKRINEEKKKDLNFDYVYINGLTLASPEKIWKRMFKGLQLQSKSKGISTKEALKRLNSHFESRNRNPVVLVVDELDQILDKQQSILYTLLEWSSHAKNMFSFVAIFNTMSLPEHGLAMRNYSRMGFKRAVFPPYNYEQLQTIVSNMLSTFKTVRLNSESITLLSRKVAAISGDARRALEIARRAMEIAEAANLSGLQAVSNAFKEIFSSAKIETIKHTTLLEQMVLKAMCDEIRNSGIEEVLTAKIYDNVVPKAVYEGMHWQKDDILRAMMRLAVMHLVIIEDNCPSLHKRVLLKVPVEDVNFALGIHTDLET